MWRALPNKVLNFSSDTSPVIELAIDCPWLPSSNSSIWFLWRLNTPLKSLPEPIGQFTGQERIPKTFSISSSNSNGSFPWRSILFINVNIGIPLILQTWNNFFVWSSTPLAESITITALSAAIRVLYVSSLKSWCPGVSSIFIQKLLYSNWRTLDATDIPLCFSISIQSDTACFWDFLDLTEPASRIAPPYNRNFSVNVVFPASGWEIIAKVLLLLTSSTKFKFCSVIFYHPLF